jgi:glycine/D-amino acid oxidase-like deaminating enzyme
MGQVMLERILGRGGRVLPVRLRAVEGRGPFVLDVAGTAGNVRVRADVLVNAAGPFAGEVAAMLGQSLPVTNVLQQKLAFADVEGAIPRRMPFVVDLDGQSIDWSEDERELLAHDATTAWLTAPMPGGIHCRPEGGDGGSWLKLGWAFNGAASQPAFEPGLDAHFPEIVLHGASRLNPSLRRYYGRLPRQRSHYGGYYTQTAENWPLIGPMAPAGSFVVGALSGFGTMAACAAGSLCAGWIAGAALPGYAAALSLARYQDQALMAELRAATDKGLL